jgi:co-chaperonin GroES (HSP10)
MTTIKPIRDNVVIKPLRKMVTDGGIVIPDSSAAQESNKVEIVAVGTGTPKKPMKLKSGTIGYRVKSWRGDCEIEINGEKHYIVNQDSILATSQ